MKQERAWKLAFRERDNQQPGCPVFQGIYEKRAKLLWIYVMCHYTK